MRRPKGYVGTNHETIGTDILSIVNALLMPESLLGVEATQKLREVDPSRWYPINWILDPLEKLDAKVGPFPLVQMGRRLFKLSHEKAVKKVASSAGDIVFGLDGMYRSANRGLEIGGWKVLEFRPGVARVEKTTPHPCALEEGILGEAMSVVGVPTLIQQESCFRRGADSCIFTFSSVVRDQRWMGTHSPR